MRTALSNDNALDGGSALVTGFFSPLINLKLILEITAAVNPVDAGAVGFDPGLEHILDAFQQQCSLLWRQIGGLGLGVQLGTVQSFISVDIANARNEALIQQQGLELAAAAFQAGVEIFGGQ